MLIFSLVSCSADELSQAFQIDRLRVLGVAAEPAEPQPGDLVTFSGLIVSPDPMGGSAWFSCSSTESTDFGCDLDPDLLAAAQTGEASLEDLQAAGFLGFLPALPPTWTVPTDYLDALDEEAKLEGSFAMVFVSALPELVEGETPSADEIELAYKRIPVSLAPTPNHNPIVATFTIDGVAVPVGAEWRVDGGQTYEIGVELSDDSVESYTYRNTDGEEETRTEEPYFSWYLQEGSFDQPSVLWPYTTVLWTAPRSPTIAEQSLWVVVRDRRGGMGWAELHAYFAN